MYGVKGKLGNFNQLKCYLCSFVCVLVCACACLYAFFMCVFGVSVCVCKLEYECIIVPMRTAVENFAR